MSNTLIAVGLILVWVGIATYADTLFKGAPVITSTQFAGGLALYITSAFLAFWTLRLQKWGWIVIIWNSASLALSLFLSVAMFSEPFTIRRRVAGALVLVAILIAE